MREMVDLAAEPRAKLGKGPAYQVRRQGKIPGIAAVHNESDLKEPVRLIVDLKRDADADVVLNQLYKFSPLQDSFSVIFLALVLEKPGAHHGSGGQGNDERNENGSREGDGKFAEQAPDDATHQQDRNEYGNQRDTDGQYRKADFLGSFQRGFHRAHSLLEMPGHVFDDDNRVIDDEAG